MNKEDVQAEIIGHLNLIKALTCLMIETNNVETENIMTIEDLCDLALKKF